MQIKWPESVADTSKAQYDPIILLYPHLQGVLLRFRYDEPFCHHLNPVSLFERYEAPYHRMSIIFTCTSLGKTLLEAAFLHAVHPKCGDGDMRLTFGVHMNGEDTTQPYVVWETMGITKEARIAQIRYLVDGLTAILEEGI